MDDNKKSTTIWLRPSVISRMDGWLEADNCQSRSEFVDMTASIPHLNSQLRNRKLRNVIKH